MLDLSHFNGIIAPLYDWILPKRKPIEFLDLLSPREDDVILEIGAGTGRITKHYGNNVRDLTLVDPAENMLKRALVHVPHAKLVKGFSESMSFFQSNTFDKVVCYDTLHHWQDQIKGLRETYRVLKPGGFVIFMEVDQNNFFGRKIQLLETILQMKSRMFTPAHLRALLERLGYKNIRYDPTNGSLTFAMLAYK